MNWRQVTVLIIGIICAAGLFAFGSTHPGCDIILGGGASSPSCRAIPSGFSTDYLGVFWAAGGAVIALAIVAALSPWGRRR